MLLLFWRRREIIKQLILRDVQSRYRGSLLGVVWTLLNPILMLLVYTFVFGVVFRSRWSDHVDNRVEFALILFCGLAAFNIAAEVIVRAPSLITSNPNFTKKVIFPLELLVISAVGAALVNGLISFLVLLIAKSLLMDGIGWAVLLLPVVLLPILLLAAGSGWILSSLGVYIRDITQIVPICVNAVLFLSPIFYPLSAIPERFQIFLILNPLSYMIDNVRSVVIWSKLPDWSTLSISFATAGLIYVLGYLWFMKTRKGFADVI